MTKSSNRQSKSKSNNKSKKKLKSRYTRSRRRKYNTHKKSSRSPLETVSVTGSRWKNFITTNTLHSDPCPCCQKYGLIGALDFVSDRNVCSHCVHKRCNLERNIKNCSDHCYIATTNRCPNCHTSRHQPGDKSKCSGSTRRVIQQKHSKKLTILASTK